MEAMSIESLLLSTWEEAGFVGKTRIPLALSDVDVLAIHAAGGKVRIGESKVREGSQKVYLVDDSTLTYMKSEGNKDFTDWMGEGWSRWLENLPLVWDDAGRPAVPWLLPASQVNEVEVIFCCNLVALCDRKQTNDALSRAAARFLQKNPAFEGRAERADFVKAQVIPTWEVVTELISAVFSRIDNGYGRRFGDPCKDLFREIHRYLLPALDRLPCDSANNKLGVRKNPFEDQIRKDMVIGLLRSMNIDEAKIRQWFVDAK